MPESPYVQPLAPRGEEEQYAEMLAQMEQIVRHVLCRTQHWKTPTGYDTPYWNEERESIAWVAVWDAYCSYKPNPDVSFPLYAFFQAVQAIRREHRIVWRWSVHTSPMPCDTTTGEPTDVVDPEWRKPFQQCEADCDLQLLLAPLSESERELIYWWCQEELTEREIAQRLNVSKTAVHKRLARIKRKLQEALTEQDMDG